MADVKVLEVRTIPAEDKLVVVGTVDGAPFTGTGSIYWTHNYWRAEEHPPELVHDDDPAGFVLPVDSDADQRAELQAEHDAKMAAREQRIHEHREAIKAMRRPMTQAELRAYCEQLLVEAAGIADAGHGVLPAAPIIDEG